MTTRTSAAPTGAPCWIDLSTSDPAATDAFYGGLFGWTVSEANDELGGYRNYSKDGVMVAGVMQAMDGAPDAWGVYLAAPDVEKVVANAPGVVSPAMAVGDLGTMALVTDPGGSLIGAWKAGEHLGFGVFGEPDTPGWFELHSKSYDADVAFYGSTFGWPVHTAMDEPGFRYSTHGEGEAQLAGIVDSSVWPDDVPGWHVYFTVADADAALAKAVSLGATVVEGVQDTPYGRLATLLDPNGARFKLQQP